MTLLVTEGLSKRFGGLTAVGMVSFTVEAGELVGIIGPNGAGKTTLFNLLTGFVRPDRGRSALNGAPIAGLAPHQIVDRGLARTFQIARPFADMTVLENVATACVCPRARRMSAGRGASERAMAVLAQVGLDGKAALPVQTLPFGDLRRVEIARAMATRPDVLLLDEPFAGLGAFEIAPLAALIRALSAQGVTILIVEHKLRELMQLVTRVIAMHFGQIIAQGAPATVARDPGVVAAYLGGTT
jgi:branched-chain amino acid transport system ATP-binding protein